MTTGAKDRPTYGHGMPEADFAADIVPVQTVAQDPVHVPWLPPRL